jgi:hypothetical protein
MLEALPFALDATLANAVRLVLRVLIGAMLAWKPK